MRHRLNTRSRRLPEGARGMELRAHTCGAVSRGNLTTVEAASAVDLALIGLDAVGVERPLVPNDPRGSVEVSTLPCAVTVDTARVQVREALSSQLHWLSFKPVSARVRCHAKCNRHVRQIWVARDIRMLGARPPSMRPPRRLKYSRSRIVVFMSRLLASLVFPASWDRWALCSSTSAGRRPRSGTSGRRDSSG